MSYKRLATFTTTTSYQNAKDLFAVLAPGHSFCYKKGSFRVALDAAFPVRISIVPGGNAGSDGLSALYDPGEYLAFSEINLTDVWIKSIGGVSSLEMEAEGGS